MQTLNYRKPCSIYGMIYPRPDWQSLVSLTLNSQFSYSGHQWLLLDGGWREEWVDGFITIADSIAQFHLIPV